MPAKPHPSLTGQPGLTGRTIEQVNPYWNCPTECCRKTQYFLPSTQIAAGFCSDFRTMLLKSSYKCAISTVVLHPRFPSAVPFSEQRALNPGLLGCVPGGPSTFGDRHCEVDQPWTPQTLRVAICVTARRSLGCDCVVSVAPEQAEAPEIRNQFPFAADPFGGWHSMFAGANVATWSLSQSTSWHGTCWHERRVTQ